MAFSKVLDVNIMYISTNRKQAVYNQLNIFIVHRHHHVMLLISRYLIVRIMYVVYNKSLEKVRVCMIADYHQTSNICMIADYYQTSNIRCTLVGNKLVDHSDVFGASPVGAAPTTSSFSTHHLASKTTAKWDENHSSFVIWRILY